MTVALLERPETGIVPDRVSREGHLDDQRRRVLGELLKEWRQREALSQMDAAHRLGVSYRSYQQYENAQVLPHPGTERRLVEGAGMTWDEYRDRTFGPMLEDRIKQLREEMAEELEQVRAELAELRARPRPDEEMPRPPQTP